MELPWESAFSFRSTLYSFLGHCLLESVSDDNTAFIQRKFWEEFPLEAANTEMNNGLEKIIQCTGRLELLPASQAIQEIQLEYTHLFLGPGQPKAPPWESVYRTPEKLLFGWPALQVRETYLQSGFEIKLKNRQPEDHLGLELMFMSTVSDSLAKALKGKDTQFQVLSTVQNQIAFINEHPLAWIADLHNDARVNASVGFYSGLIELIWGILLWDLELLKEMLQELSN
jgi:TorA maturation chaperone TorD